MSWLKKQKKSSLPNSTAAKPQFHHPAQEPSSAQPLALGSFPSHARGKMPLTHYLHQVETNSGCQ